MPMSPIKSESSLDAAFLKFMFMGLRLHVLVWDVNCRVVCFAA